MKSDNIKKIAAQLFDHFNVENIEDHPTIVEAEKTNNDMVLYTVASALASIENIIKNATDSLNIIADKYAGELDEEDIDEMAALAESFDKSNDDLLKKQASVLDQILVNFSQISGTKAKEAQDREIEKIRQKYRDQHSDECYKDAAEDQKKDFQAQEAVKAIKKQIKEYRPLEASLSTRTCPDHPGAQMARIGNDVYQCSLDKNIYNYKEGFKTMKGNVVPGSSVEEQTRWLGDRDVESMSFSTRETELNK